MGVLDSAKDARNFNVGKVALLVAAAGGPSIWGQVWRMAAMRIVGPRFTTPELYTYGFFRPEIKRADRALYLSELKNEGFNQGTATEQSRASKAFVDDKLAFEHFARSKGLAIAETLAGYGVADAALEPLGDEAAILRFLRRPGVLPVFGKPRASSHAFGVVSILSISADGDTLTLGNGMTYPAKALAAEVVANWSGGYLFQRHLFNHPSLQTHLGRATATARVTTIMGESGPELLYFVQRLPSATAMHDNSSVNRRGFAAVDPVSHKVTRIGIHTEGHVRDLDRWNDPTMPMIGVEVPFYDAAVDLALATHRLLPKLPVVGCDVALTEKGPVLTEANTNPYHSVYQVAHGKGILSAELRGRLAKAVDLMGRI